ncbi:MAG: molybdate ABC transporter permease subunit [Thermoleophilia bacterium]|nr:molybdate ABC transporter permease subunit [Thermoleophilia bacterium]
MIRSRVWFGPLLVIALTAVLVFLTVPVLAIFLETTPAQIVRKLGEDQAREALWLSARTTGAAMLLIVAVGTPAAYLLATRRFRGRALVITLIELPLVMPPVVAGIALFAAFGRAGLLGDELGALGLSIPFTEAAVVMAVAFVASPFYIRQAIAAFEAVDPVMVDAARSLGAGPGRAFWRISLPLASGGLTAGWALAFARGLGEFGATIIFAGSLQGTTQTLPLAVYAQFESDFDAALAIGGMLIVVSAAILLAVKLGSSWTTRLASPSTSIFRGAPSA